MVIVIIIFFVSLLTGFFLSIMPDHYKLLHLLNVTKIYYRLQNLLTRFKSCIVTTVPVYTVPGERPYLHELTKNNVNFH